MSRQTLSDEARGSLLRRVAVKQQAAEARAEQPPKSKPVQNPTDFGTLPGSDELALYRMIATELRLEPFFRMHDARAGAHSEIGGERFLNFSSYDYLGLNGHPEVTAAAKAAIDRYGISAGASRHVGGERPPHRLLENALAKHYGVESAVTFVSGYATNLGVIGHIVGAKDLLVMDSVIHNSASVGGVLSGANRRSFPHNDLDVLEDVLATTRDKYERALIVVEGHYSMHGDIPDLPRLIEIKKRHRAWLMVDEAHSLGVIGARGHGIAEHFDVDPRDVDIWMGTLSKTLAGCGGYIAGTDTMVHYVRCTVGAFVYSVAMPPAVAAASEKALEIMHREPERVAALQRNADFFHRLAKDRGLDTGTTTPTAISPIVVGDSLPAVQLSQRLYDRRINVQPVIYPAVPAKSSRLRFFLTTMHSEDDIAAAIDAVVEEMKDGDLRAPGI